MKKFYWIFLSLLIVFTACKKKTDENNNTGWTEEDQAFYNNVITLQDKAGENWTTWSQTMDSLDAINKLQQFFLSDPSVTSATIGNQGIAVQYSKGMRGGIFINPEDEFDMDAMGSELFPKTASSDLHEKSVVNIKNAIFLNPSYWERSDNANSVIASYYLDLPKVGFNFQNIYKGLDASLDRFTQLAGFGLIHVYSHGWAWPKNISFSEVYLMTGEKASETISAKYFDDIKNGNIIIAKTKTYVATWDNVYWISEKFIADYNDFSKDTVLFYGGFCYSFLGTWPEIRNTFANGAYFGYSWRVKTEWNCDLAKNLISGLADTTKKPPLNTEIWFINPALSKERWDPGYNLFCHLEYTGDATLTLWIYSQIVTDPITSITSTTATGGGNIKSDGGFPITERGVCWSTSQNPTVSDSKTIDGSGTGSFTSNLTGLTINTLYYVRAYATNSKGTMYGNQVSFTTEQTSTFDYILHVAVHKKLYDKDNNLLSSEDRQIGCGGPGTCTQNGNTLTGLLTSPGTTGTLNMTLNSDHTLSYTLNYQQVLVDETTVIICSVNNIPFYPGWAWERYRALESYPLIQSFEMHSYYPDGLYATYTLIQNTQFDFGTEVNLYESK